VRFKHEIEFESDPASNWHAMSFVEHEWKISDAKAARRLYIEIGKHFLKTNR
jgi:hypothetical protein